MKWVSFTEIIDYQLSYPDTALFGFSVDADQFDGRVPGRGYEIYGIICEVPTNYDPIGKTYDGIWDGSFKRAWTDNNAWVLYNILTTPRYWGEESELFGSTITPAQIDKWSFYDAAQWCDELIPDGKGGTECRFNINCCINEREEAYTVIQALCSSFNAIAYIVTGKQIGRAHV